MLEWKGENVNPLEWDWKNNEGRLVLIKTVLDAAAKELFCISFSVHAKLDVLQKDTVVRIMKFPV